MQRKTIIDFYNEEAEKRIEELKDKQNIKRYKVSNCRKLRPKSILGRYLMYQYYKGLIIREGADGLKGDRIKKNVQ